MLTEDQVNQLIEAAVEAARPPMKRWLGTSPRGFDAADAIAQGIAQGVKRGLYDLGLTIKP